MRLDGRVGASDADDPTRWWLLGLVSVASRVRTGIEEHAATRGLRAADDADRDFVFALLGALALAGRVQSAAGELFPPRPDVPDEVQGPTAETVTVPSPVGAGWLR